MLNLLRNSINAIRSISGLDSDASAFITAAGLTDPTQKSAINTLVKDMKAAGLWTKMKAVYPMIGGTATSMKFNLKDPRDLDAAFRLTWSGGWTYSATGATPNGTNAYADTKFNQENNWTSNTNASIGFYSRTDISNGGVDIGALTNSATATNGSSIYGRYGGNVIFCNLNSSGAQNEPNTSSLGFYITSRNASSQYKLYKFGTTIINNTKFGGLSTNINKNIYLCAANDATVGGAASYSSRQQAFAFIGDYITEQESFLFNQIVEKYQVALSRGVQAAQSFYYNSAYSNEANTYLYSTQITGTTQVSAINTLINGLKANNLWSKMKAVYPFVTDIKNMLAYTENYVVGTWNKQNCTATANTIVAPNGTTTANTITATSISSVFFFQSLPTLTNGQVYTVSRYVKAGTKNFCTIGLHGLADAFFDLVNLTYSFSGTGAVSASITDVGDGWRRITATYTWTGSTYNVYFAMASSLSSSTGITVGDYQYTWGTQVELGSSATTYQPILGANNYATNVAAQMKFNLVNPQDSDAAFRLAFSGGWTYSTNGAQPNGTNGFADTFLIPNTSLSTSSSHLSFYSRTNTTSGSYAGYDLARTHFALITQFNGNIFYANLETAGSYAASYTSANGLGHFIASRINNTTTQGFKNGLKVINASQNSSLATSSLIISNNGGANYSNKQTAFVSIGDGFTDSEAALFYQLVQQFQTDLTRQV